MLSTVLVPLDGSTFAETALDFAVPLAFSARARIYLVMAKHPVTMLAGMGETAGFLPDSDRESDRESGEYLAGTVAKWGEVGDWPLQFRLADGSAGEAICGEAGPEIHHIDENPSNNVLENLIPLCPTCHHRDIHDRYHPIDPERLWLFQLYGRRPTIVSG